MPEQTVTCPHCGQEFELGKALTDKISHALRGEIEEGARKREEDLKVKVKEFEERQANLDDEVATKLAAERKKVVADAERKAQEDFTVRLKASEDELEDKRKKLADAEKTELDLRKRERELVEASERQELELVRRLDEERGKIAEEALGKAAEQQQLKMKEKDNLIASMKEKMADLQRKIEVGSQESQGEALEDELIERLRRQFPFDECEEVKKGQKGADVVQRVRNEAGRICGTILWESKNAKTYQKVWIDKLKGDQREASADIAVLMTMALPPEVKDFDTVDDVWVTSVGSAMSLCGVLRQTLIGVERARVVSTHQEGMKDIVYKYVTGQEFSQRIKTIVSAYQQMQSDLTSEKNSMNRIWKSRQRQITTVLDNVSAMAGEIEGLAGGVALLPAGDVLSLEGIPP